MNGIGDMNGTNGGEKSEVGAAELLGRKIAPLGEIIEAWPLHGGTSCDRKYKVHFYGYDGAYLLRLFSEASVARKRTEFEALHRIQAIPVNCSRPIAIGLWEPEGIHFLLVSYIEGEDAGQALLSSSKPQQLRIGMQAGEALRRIASYEAPEEAEKWSDDYGRKIAGKLARLETESISFEGFEAIASRICSREILLENRPTVFQHGNFQPANLIVQNGRLAGVVGFERFGWGDPIYEFSGLGLGGREISTLFCTGQILGYHGGQEPEPYFWELYAFYAASGAVSLLVETLDRFPERLPQAISLVERLAADHDGFSRDQPSWFAAL
ncbi:phosphotransferase family protein [Saccharibacillus kuerlensis]|uniref:Aminoglycoside phosphotransferase n=1 Tax=Saccharibacillus kuerlensis TaxID=459527 RepID=A0ABQ2KS32_9BACL|nr:aminoglycoside phosphotransferase family protein [Saccharibacillus kuerlensis]GGN90974.1 aminoglycoside phosphotransferase [Saccharibacillus kuerlensis]